MPVRRVVAHQNVEADRDRVALQRGPIVYAAEWADNPGGKVRNLVLPDANALTSEFRADMLNGVSVIKGRAVGLKLDEKGTVVKTEQPLDDDSLRHVGQSRPRRDVCVAGAHRGRRKADALPHLAMASKITASREQGQGYLPSIVEGDEPRNSRGGNSMFNWWPLQGWGPNCEPNPSAPERNRPNVQQGRVDPDGLRQALDRDRSRALLVRRATRAAPCGSQRRGSCSTRTATTGSRWRRPTSSASPRTPGTRSRSSR